MKLTMEDDKLAVERERIAKFTDKELEDYVCDNVSGAAVLSSRGYGWCSYDQKCGIAYDEAVKRGKPDLYKQGFSRSARSFGHDL